MAGTMAAPPDVPFQHTPVEAAPSRLGGLANDAADRTAESGGGARLDGANSFGDTLFTDRNWAIVDALKAVASEIGVPPVKVAHSWALSRPAVDTVLVSVSRVDQLQTTSARSV